MFSTETGALHITQHASLENWCTLYESCWHFMYITVGNSG